MPRSIAGRRLFLTDAAVLIAVVATSAAIAARRLVGDAVAWPWGPQWPSPPTFSSYLFCSTSWIQAFTPGLALATLAAAGLGFRHPRPPLRYLARQPGTVAVWVASLAIAAHPLKLAVRAVEPWLGDHSVLFTLEKAAIGFGARDICLVGWCVGSAWITLALSGRWSRPTGWLDHLGRVLGWLWIALVLYWTILFPEVP